MRETGETDAQFTRRMREKHKEVLEQIDAEGLTPIQQSFDDLICRIFNIRKVLNAHEKTLKDLNKQIDIYLTQTKK